MVKKVCEAMQRWRMFHNSKELEKEAIDFLEEARACVIVEPQRKQNSKSYGASVFS
jgi:hypothetical protein